MHVLSFLSLFFSLANSKSEGSPVLPHEPTKVKPEESRDITRPSRPAVSDFLPKNFYVFPYLRILRWGSWGYIHDSEQKTEDN